MCLSGINAPNVCVSQSLSVYLKWVYLALGTPRVRPLKFSSQAQDCKSEAVQYIEGKARNFCHF